MSAENPQVVDKSSYIAEKLRQVELIQQHSVDPSSYRKISGETLFAMEKALKTDIAEARESERPLTPLSEAITEQQAPETVTELLAKPQVEPNPEDKRKQAQRLQAVLENRSSSESSEVLLPGPQGTTPFKVRSAPLERLRRTLNRDAAIGEK